MTEENKTDSVVNEPTNSDMQSKMTTTPVSNEQVMEMFSQLMASFNGLKDDIKQLKEDKSNQNCEVKMVKEQQDRDRELVSKIQCDSKLQQTKIKQLADVVAYQSHVIDELKSKIENFELEKMRLNLLIHGIKEVKDENCTTMAKNFFKEKLELTQDIQIRKAFRVGKGKTRPILTCLSNAHEKGLIYANIKKLQELKDANNKQIYRIEDQLPPKVRARKQRARNLMWRNKQPTVLNKLTLAMKKGQLQIDGKPYRSQISKPDDHKLLNLTPEEIEELDKIHIVQGEPISKDSSTFIGFTCDVNSYQEVNAAYEAVCFYNMDARHIMCASVLPGADVLQCFDHNDDKEHEGGAVLLDFMVNANLQKRAIFVSRHYDRVHIGPERFDSIIAATKSAVSFKPFNTVTEKYQFHWSRDRQSSQTSKKRFAKPNDTDTTSQDMGSEDEIFKQANPKAAASWAEQTLPASKVEAHPT